MNVILYFLVPIVWALSFDSNIVINPGAEADATSISPWSGDAGVSNYPCPNKQGNNAFSGGSSSSSSMKQWVDLAPLTAQMIKWGVTAEVSAWIGDTTPLPP